MPNANTPPLDNLASTDIWDDLPDVLMDRVQLGLSVSLPLPTTLAAAFCKALVHVGLIAKAPARGREIGAKLALAGLAVDLPAGGEARPDGFLILGDGAGRLTLKPTTCLLPNVMRALRTTLDKPLAPAADGSDNLACHFDPDTVRKLMGWQLAAVAAVVDALVAALAAASAAASLPSALAGGALVGDVWVQHAEFCRDYLMLDAAAFVADMAERPIPGAGRAQQTVLGNALSLSWHEGSKAAPERKAYAKRHDTVRSEIALRDRATVRNLLKSAGAAHADRSGLPGAGEGIAGTLRRLGVAAAPLLDDLVGFANEVVDVPPRAGADLVVAFAPLLRLVAPAPRLSGAGGRRPGPGVARLARNALDALVAHGRFDMRGAGASDGVLLALREMADAGALRVSAARPRLFTVSPAFEAARQALAGVRQWPDEHGDVQQEASAD